jgi:hypothetical protein
MRERLDQAHVKALQLIAESRWLRLKSRALVHRIREGRVGNPRSPMAGTTLGASRSKRNRVMVDLQVKKECDVFDPNPVFEGFKPIYRVKPGEPANDVSYSVRALTPEGAALLKEWCSEEDPPYTDHAGTTCILCLLSAQLNDLINVVTKANLTIDGIAIDQLHG